MKLARTLPRVKPLGFTLNELESHGGGDGGGGGGWDLSRRVVT